MVKHGTCPWTRPRPHSSELILTVRAQTWSSPVRGGRIVDVRTGFLNSCKRASLTDLHFHDLRHTFASQFMMAGGDLYILKEILGHKSITMTQRYAHLSPTYKIKAIDRMNTLWAGAQPQPSTSEMLRDNPSVTAASQAALQDTLPGLTPLPTRP
jgi:integrase-like protein